MFTRFRIITNGQFFRAQIRTALFFWVDLDHNGYRYWNGSYAVSDEPMAHGYIRKVKERDAQFNAKHHGRWRRINTGAKG